MLLINYSLRRSKNYFRFSQRITLQLLCADRKLRSFFRDLFNRLQVLQQFTLAKKRYGYNQLNLSNKERAFFECFDQPHKRKPTLLYEPPQRYSARC